MAYTNPETLKLLNAKINAFEETINVMEREMKKKGDEFDKAALSFQFGRLQANYIQIAELLKNLKIIT